MGRPGITFDQVAGAAQALEAEGAAATLQAVRERLGDTGSMSTIQRHLIAWRANQPKEAPASVELPSDVVRSMNAWVVQASTAARAAAETEMGRAQSEADLLAKDGIQLEAERDRLIDEAVRLTTQRDQAQALATERAEDIERMARDLEREREVANDAQIKTAESQLKLAAQAEQIGDLKAEVVRLAGALDAERQARGEIQTRAAVLQSELSAAHKEADTERTRANGLQSRLDESRKEEEDLRDELGQQLQEVARLTSELDAARKSAGEVTDRARSLQAQVDQLQAASQAAREEYDRRSREAAEASRADLLAERERTDRYQTEAQAALLLNADLKGKLAVAEKEVERLNTIR